MRRRSLGLRTMMMKDLAHRRIARRATRTTTRRAAVMVSLAWSTMMTLIDKVASMAVIERLS